MPLEAIVDGEQIYKEEAESNGWITAHRKQNADKTRFKHETNSARQTGAHFGPAKASQLRKVRALCDMSMAEQQVREYLNHCPSSTTESGQQAPLGPAPPPQGSAGVPPPPPGCAGRILSRNANGTRNAIDFGQPFARLQQNCCESRSPTGAASTSAVARSWRPLPWRPPRELLRPSRRQCAPDCRRRRQRRLPATE
ncbi:hypothetical protein MRX96_012711 [Rhipicephalus microplus]